MADPVIVIDKLYVYVYLIHNQETTPSLLNPSSSLQFVSTGIESLTNHLLISLLYYGEVLYTTNTKHTLLRYNKFNLDLSPTIIDS